ncbi:hypothetical protein M9H77_01855 [Catharanthus roseus]|uniref:Uncharacterized protein n=1 Tax=Catharanthus roseus TaxID=4058 RepID=A0ACC0C764_CATRO|nr:hypothetical protein M9H77_01855 [Catharanthus roseus]
MAQYNNMEADKMLDVYIYDYLVKRKYSNSAKTFQTEAHIPAKTSAIDAPGGFLFEWWSIFWDVFIARYRPGSKSEEQLQQQKLQQTSQQQQWLEQMQLQLILQKHIEQQKQQQQRDEIQVQSSAANSNITRQNLGSTNALAKKIMSPHRILQPRCSQNIGQPSDAAHVALLRSAGSGGQLPQQFPYDGTPSNLSYFQAMNDQMQQTWTSQSSITPATYLRVPSSDGSLDKVTESDQTANNFPLEGWPLSVFQQQILKNNQCHKEHIQPMPHFQQFKQPNYQDQQPDKMDAVGGNADCAAISNTSRDYSQATENQVLRKRKQPISSMDPPNSSGTGTTSRSKRSSSMLSINKIGHHGDSSSSDAHIFHRGSFGPQTSGANQLADSDNNGSLADNVDSFFSSSNPGKENTTGEGLEGSQDITFSEVGIIHANLVNHCDFSSDGKLIATSGNDEKIMIWSVETREEKCTIEEHSDVITDIRFSPRLPRIATSSLDKTVKIWNVNNPGYPLRSFVGHSAPVMSLDFHPKTEDLVCSCDDATAIRYWSIKSGGCTGLSKADATQVRFQPVHGRFLAAAVRNGVSIIDVETAQANGYPLKGHATNVISVCWNSSGEYLASLSEDVIRVWKIGSGEVQDCIHELSTSSKKFQCCVFHPCYPSSLVIGFNQSLELWHMAENKMITLLEQPINALAVSPRSGYVASASDENLIKLWK